MKEKPENTQVVLKTNLGDITLALFRKEAPETCANFLKYVEEKHYNKVLFHRVIDGFMIQTGGVNTDYVLKPTHAAIRCESNNGLSNLRGMVAMARTSDPHSASSQFFINVADNTFLDYRNSTPSGFGYCVFGKVVKGMEVVDKIKSVKTTTQKGWSDIPVQPVEIYEVVELLPST